MIEEKKLGILAVIILIILSGVAVVFLSLSALQTTTLNTGENYNTKTGYTQTYTNVTVEEAYNLINKSQEPTYNLTIIDCRGIEGCSTCQFKHGHIPGAVRNDNPLTLENLTDDILVYSVDGKIGAEFCKNLTHNLVYGKIYNLEGGWNAWKLHNETYGWPPIKTGIEP